MGRVVLGQLYRGHRADFVCAYGVLENLEALGKLPPVVFVAALPLKIANGTGSPLRPVAFVPKR